jgi:hypothetical protein
LAGLGAEPQQQRDRHGLRPRRGTEPLLGPLDVEMRGRPGDAEALADLGIAQPLRHQGETLALALAQGRAARGFGTRLPQRPRAGEGGERHRDGRGAGGGVEPVEPGGGEARDAEALAGRALRIVDRDDEAVAPAELGGRREDLRAGAGMARLHLAPRERLGRPRGLRDHDVVGGEALAGVEFEPFPRPVEQQERLLRVRAGAALDGPIRKEADRVGREALRLHGPPEPSVEGGQGVGGGDLRPQGRLVGWCRCLHARLVPARCRGRMPDNPAGSERPRPQDGRIGRAADGRQPERRVAETVTLTEVRMTGLHLSGNFEGTGGGGRCPLRGPNGADRGGVRRIRVSGHATSRTGRRAAARVARNSVTRLLQPPAFTAACFARALLHAPPAGYG